MADLEATLHAAFVAGWNARTDDSDPADDDAREAASVGVLLADLDDDELTGPSYGAQLIAAERRRQVQVEDYQPEHDRSSHHGEELALAACSYAIPEDWRRMKPTLSGVAVPTTWPWSGSDWKPSPQITDSLVLGRVRDLVKAGALIAAEIDRLTPGCDSCGDRTKRLRYTETYGAEFCPSCYTREHPPEETP